MAEVAACLEHAHGVELEHVFASAAAPPSHYQCPPMDDISETDFLGLLNMVGFSNAKALENSEVRSLLMPMILADFGAAAGYSLTNRTLDRLSTPITAIAGRRDLFMPPQFTPLWQRYTTKDLSLYLVDDHHYFVETHRDEIVDLVKTTLLGTSRSAKAVHHLSADAWDDAVLSVAKGAAVEQWEPVAQWCVEHRAIPTHPRGTIVLIPDSLGTSFPLMSTVKFDAAWHVVEFCYPERADLVTADAFERHLDLFASLLADLPGPLILAGHGLGAICAAAVAARRPGQIQHLFVINAVPPQYFATPIYEFSSDDEVLDFMRACHHPNPTTDLIPQIRAGLRLSSLASRGSSLKLDCRITVLRANLDLIMRGYHTAARWSQFAESASMVDYVGNHFSAVDDVMTPLVNTLAMELTNGAG